MKDINNKGLTLTELIVSFAIVGVAMIYFFETLYTVRRLYTVSQAETQRFVDENYVLRIADAYTDKNCPDGNCGTGVIYDGDYKIEIVSNNGDLQYYKCFSNDSSAWQIKKMEIKYSKK